MTHVTRCMFGHAGARAHGAMGKPITCVTYVTASRQLPMPGIVSLGSQCHPTAHPTGPCREGELFAVERVTMRDHTSDVVFWVRGWDLAGTVDGDWTVGVLMGRTREGKFVIGDVRRLRGRPDAVDQAILECARADTRRTRVSIPKDAGQAGIAQVLAITKMLAGYTVLNSPETGKKEVRAEPLAAQVNVGNVTMIPGDWNHAYREELRSFPYGKYDDQVDASSRAFMELTATKGPMIINKDMLRHA